MSAQLAATSLFDVSPAATPTKRPSPKLARHARRCLVCHHADRPAIEDDFLHWRASTQIAAEFGLPDRRVVYRHARATGLYQRRMKNMRVASSYIVQHADRVTPNAKQVLDAVRACSLIDASGVWHEPIRHVIIEHVNAPQSIDDSTLAGPSETSISNVYSVQLESAATPTKQTPPTTSNVYSSVGSSHTKSASKVTSADSHFAPHPTPTPVAAGEPVRGEAVELAFDFASASTDAQACAAQTITTARATTPRWLDLCPDFLRNHIAKTLNVHQS